MIVSKEVENSMYQKSLYFLFGAYSIADGVKSGNLRGNSNFSQEGTSFHRHRIIGKAKHIGGIIMPEILIVHGVHIPAVDKND